MSNGRILSRVGFEVKPRKLSQVYKLANDMRSGRIKSPDDIPMNIRQSPSLSIHFKFRDPDKLNAGEEDLIKALLDFYKHCDDALDTDVEGPQSTKSLKNFLKGKEETALGSIASVTFRINHLKTPDDFKNFGKYALPVLEALKLVVNVGNRIYDM